MAFSDNIDAIKGYAANAAQIAARKTKMLAAIAKANISILSEEEKVKKAQIELGKVYYKDFILDEEPDQAEYLPWCDQITDSLKLIESYKAQIEAAKQEDAPAQPAAEQPAEAEPATPAAEIPEIVVVEEVPSDEPEDKPAE